MKKLQLFILVFFISISLFAQQKDLEYILSEDRHEITPEKIAELIDNGANPNVIGNSTMMIELTPFEYFIFYYESYNPDIRYKVLKTFVEKGADLNKIGTGEMEELTPLQFFVSYLSELSNIEEILTFFINNGADISLPFPQYSEYFGLDFFQVFLVNYCEEATFTSPELLQLLIDKGADVNMISEKNSIFEGRSPLHFLCYYAEFVPERFDNVKVLIENGADMEFIFDDNLTLFQYIIYYYEGDESYLEFAQYMLEKGVDYDKKFPAKKYFYGLTPLQYLIREPAMAEGAAYDLAVAIINKGIDVNLKYPNKKYLDGLTYSNFIIANYDFYSPTGIKLLNLLIEKGADTNIDFPKNKYYSGLSPLEYFISVIYYEGDFDSESCDFLKVLIEKGADINNVTNPKSDLEGLTSFQFIVNNYDLFSGTVFLELVDYCIDMGGDIDLASPDESQMQSLSVFQYYIANKLYDWHLDLALKMIEKSKQINEPAIIECDLEGSSIFEYFILKNYYTSENGAEILLKFIDYGADINNISDNEYGLNGLSAFQYLVKNQIWYKDNKGMEILQKCVENNANLTAKDLHEKIPLDYADADTPVEIIKLLTPKN